MRVISYQTYKDFAKKYKISLTKKNKEGKRVKKTIKELQKQIYNYENKNEVKKGLYFI